MTGPRQDLADELARRSFKKAKLARDAIGGEEDLAMDPPVSDPQAKAMHAAAEGNSTLGIPKKVGQEFVGKDSMACIGQTITFLCPTKNGKTKEKGKMTRALPGGRIEVKKGADYYQISPDDIVSGSNIDGAQDARPTGRWGGRTHKGA